MHQELSIIGFGEAAQTFCDDGRWGALARVYDRKTADLHTKSEKLNDYERLGVQGFDTNAEAISSASVILSLVTADQSLPVGEETAHSISKGALFLDMNSVAPDTKRATAELINSAGGRYVDVAIMAPVQPKALNVPVLISGQAAGDAYNALSDLGFKSLQLAGLEVGQASTIKMLRSIMIKGIEALTAECVMAAHKAGALNAVLSALGGDWAEKADYNLDRMMIHGTRRAAEMEEVVKTIEGLGMEASMTRGTVQRQTEIGALGFKSPPDTLEKKLALLMREESIS